MAGRLKRILRCASCGRPLAEVWMTYMGKASDVGVAVEIVCPRRRCRQTRVFDMRFVDKGPIESGKKVAEVLGCAS